MGHACFNSDLVLSPAPYQAPVAVTEAIAAVHTIRLIFCCCADISLSPSIPEMFPHRSASLTHQCRQVVVAQDLNVRRKVVVASLL
jgi:hypothetical protein